jgi:anti-sigma factor RsiW
MTMGYIDCSDARPLVPSYLDGELSEAQAGPLRRHLLDCQACRAGAQSGKNLRRWFVAGEPVAVPRDFAARVARLAFQGGTVTAPALSDFELVPAAPPPRTLRGADEARILKFVLRLTVAAALVALLASVAIQSLRRPSTAELRADDRPTMSLDQAVERLKQINEQATTTPGSAPHDRQP